MSSAGIHFTIIVLAFTPYLPCYLDNNTSIVKYSQTTPCQWAHDTLNTWIQGRLSRRLITIFFQLTIYRYTEAYHHFRKTVTIMIPSGNYRLTAFHVFVVTMATTYNSDGVLFQVTFTYTPTLAVFPTLSYFLASHLKFVKRIENVSENVLAKTFCPIASNPLHFENFYFFAKHVETLFKRF